tara:strand:+ start:1508 stop:1696 length:189 start_codon:yes stop_codon:yes gene_type:complete
MNVKELIENLEKVKDKNLRVAIGDIEDSSGSYPNYIVVDIEVYTTSNSGYEEAGEVRLVTSE